MLWIFLVYFHIFVPMAVTGQSMVFIERDTFLMYSNPLKNKLNVLNVKQ